MLDSGTIALQNRGPFAFLASQMLCEDLIYDVIFFFIAIYYVSSWSLVIMLS